MFSKLQKALKGASITKWYIRRCSEDEENDCGVKEDVNNDGRENEYSMLNHGDSVYEDNKGELHLIDVNIMGNGPGAKDTTLVGLGFPSYIFDKDTAPVQKQSIKVPVSRVKRSKLRTDSGVGCTGVQILMVINWSLQLDMRGVCLVFNLPGARTLFRGLPNYVYGGGQPPERLSSMLPKYLQRKITQHRLVGGPFPRWRVRFSELDRGMNVLNYFMSILQYSNISRWDDKAQAATYIIVNMEPGKLKDLQDLSCSSMSIGGEDLHIYGYWPSFTYFLRFLKKLFVCLNIVSRISSSDQTQTSSYKHVVLQGIVVGLGVGRRSSECWVVISLLACWGQQRCSFEHEPESTPGDVTSVGSGGGGGGVDLV
ncbi:hypothetical protein BDQ17DRAFT_1337246 [Cyathus striatus]|nr:hypothetical protein BDQ17DRAFT_1337246 [Cyathus striatus]